MRLPRKLKKKLKRKYSTEIVGKIISGELVYKSKNVSIFVKNGYKTINGKKTIFIKI